MILCVGCCLSVVLCCCCYEVLSVAMYVVLCCCICCRMLSVLYLVLLCVLMCVLLLRECRVAKLCVVGCCCVLLCALCQKLGLLCKTDKSTAIFTKHYQTCNKRGVKLKQSKRSNGGHIELAIAYL